MFTIVVTRLLKFYTFTGSTILDVLIISVKKTTINNVLVKYLLYNLYIICEHLHNSSVLELKQHIIFGYKWFSQKIFES